MLFYDRQGNPVTDGLAATGMTVRSYTIIVPGDADGNGYVDAQDIVRGIELCLQDEIPALEALALDLNGTGALEWEDLVLCSRSLDKNPR